MKKEDGMSILNGLITLVITVLIIGVIIAMVFKKPEDSENTNTQNSINTQNSVNVSSIN